MNFIKLFNEIIPAQVFGWAVIHTLWIGMVIWMLYTIGKSVFHHSATIKYYLALFMQMMLFLSFSGALIFEAYNAPNTVSIVDSSKQSGASNLQLISSNSSSFDFSNFSESGIGNLIDASTPVISVLWILGSLFMITRFSANLFYIENLRKTGIENMDDYWIDKFQSLIEQLNLSRKIQLLESQMIDSPMTIGHFKPLILIPTGMISLLPYEQVEAILLHELAHIKRSDYLVNLFQNTIESLLFFHPVTWILSSNIRNERENLCDDYSINAQKDPMHLAKALFEIQKNVSHVPGLAMGSNGSKYLLKKRIERLFNVQNNKSGLYKGILPAALLTLFILCVSVFQYSNITAADSKNLIPQNTVLPELMQIPSEPEEIQKTNVPDNLIEEEVLSSNSISIENNDKQEKVLAPSNQNNSNSISVSANDDEITVKKSADDGRKIEVVFSSPRNIKKLKIDGKKIKKEDFDQYEKLLDQEVFSAFGTKNKRNSISYTYEIDDEKKVAKSNDYNGNIQTVVVQTDKGNKNKIVVKIDTEDGKTEVIEIPSPEIEIIEVQELLDDVLSDIDIDIDFDSNDFSKEIIESIDIDAINHGLEEAIKSLEQSSKELEEKSKAINIEFDDFDMTEVEKEMKKAISEIQAEIEIIKQKENEISKKEKNIQVKVIAAEKAQKEASSKMNKMISEFEKDGLIKKGLNQLEVQFENGNLIINGEKQSDEIAKKYFEMLGIDESGKIHYSKSMD